MSPRLRNHLLVATLGVAISAPIAIQGHTWWTHRTQAMHLVDADPALRTEATDFFLAKAPSDPSLRRLLAEAAPRMPLNDAKNILGGVAKRMSPHTDPALLSAASALAFDTDMDALLDRQRLMDWMLVPLKTPREMNDADREALRAFIVHEIQTMPSSQAARLGGVVVRHAGEGPLADAARLACYARLEAMNDAEFPRFAALLDGEGLWATQEVPLTLFVRQVRHLALDSPTTQSRDRAIYLLRLRADAGHEAKLAELLPVLVTDADPTIRFKSLRLAEAWAGRAPQAMAAIEKAKGDIHHAIARQAWLALGLLGQTPVDAAALDAIREPAVAEAACWATLHAHPTDASALAAVAAVMPKPALTASAVAALGESRLPAAQSLLQNLLAEGLAADPERQLAQWRAMILVQSPPPNLASFATDGCPASLRAAALYRLGQAPAEGPLPTDETGRLLRLAALEGLAPDSVHLPLAEEDLALCFLAAARAEKDPRQAMNFVHSIAASPDAALRAAAVDLALHRFTLDERTELARTLVSGTTEAERQTGAILCGAGKLNPRRIVGGSVNFLFAHPEWTEEKLYALDDAGLEKLGLSTTDALKDNAQRWHDAKTPSEHATRLATAAGQRLRGDLPVPAETIETLLWDKRLPLPTSLLARLYEDPHAALGLMLSDEPLPGLDAESLLVDGRWMTLIGRVLPPDAPRLLPWSDPGLRRLRFEQLRIWWRLEELKSAKAQPEASHARP